MPCLIDRCRRACAGFIMPVVGVRVQLATVCTACHHGDRPAGSFLGVPATCLAACPPARRRASSSISHRPESRERDGRARQLRFLSIIMSVGRRACIGRRAARCCARRAGWRLAPSRRPHTVQYVRTTMPACVTPTACLPFHASISLVSRLCLFLARGSSQTHRLTNATNLKHGSMAS
jgi:hypothetical protein